MSFLNIMIIKSKNMFRLIIEINNILRFNTSRLKLWLFFIYVDKDQKVYT